MLTKTMRSSSLILILAMSSLSVAQNGTATVTDVFPTMTSTPQNQMTETSQSHPLVRAFGEPQTGQAALLDGATRAYGQQPEPDQFKFPAATPKPKSRLAIIRRHPVVFAVVTGVAVGLTFALIERRGHCPGEYTSGDPPCPPPDRDFKH